jgi:uncharacterized Rmd1/YagE family protein
MIRRIISRSYSSTQSFVTKKKPTVRRVKEGPSAEYADSVVHLESKPEAKAQSRQRCFAVCTARSYNLSTVRSVMAKLNGQNLQVQRGSNWDDECMHFVMSDKSRRINEGKLAEAFFMKDGCMVTWNTTKELEAHLLKNIKEAEVHPYDSLKDAEEMEYIVDELRPSGVVHEDIVIGHKEDTRESVIAKLAFSHGLARSTQLGVLENHLSEFLANIEHLPEFMIQGQEPPLNSKQVMVKSGQLLHIRGLLNLHSELVDASPEFYWSRSELGRYYEQVSRLMEMQPRIRVLNQRLDHANRLVDWMENHLSKKHGTRMEVIIIALIAVEVCFELIHYIQ